MSYCLKLEQEQHEQDLIDCMENEYMDYLYDLHQEIEDEDLQSMLRCAEDRAIVQMIELYKRMGEFHMFGSIQAIYCDTCGWINLRDREDYYESMGVGVVNETNEC